MQAKRVTIKKFCNTFKKFYHQNEQRNIHVHEQHRIMIKTMTKKQHPRIQT